MVSSQQQLSLLRKNVATFSEERISFFTVIDTRNRANNKLKKQQSSLTALSAWGIPGWIPSGSCWEELEFSDKFQHIINILSSLRRWSTLFLRATAFLTHYWHLPPRCGSLRPAAWSGYVGSSPSRGGSSWAARLRRAGRAPSGPAGPRRAEPGLGWMWGACRSGTVQEQRRDSTRRGACGRWPWTRHSNQA